MWCSILEDYVSQKIYSLESIQRTVAQMACRTKRPNPDNPRSVSCLFRDDDEWYENWNSLDNHWDRNDLVVRRRALLYLGGPFFTEGVCRTSRLLCHPPSIFPIVSSDSASIVYFFVSSDFISQAI
jgi:hypothetical protein